MQALVRKILNFLYRFRKKEDSDIRRILFLFPSSAVGDTVIETFFIREVKKLYPQAVLDIAILAPYAVLLEHNPDIRHIYKMPVATGPKLVWLMLWAFVFRRKHYDLLLDLPHNGYAPFRQILLYFIGARQTLSCNTQGYDFITYPLMWTENVPRHITEEVYIKALKLLGGGGPFDVQYYLYLPADKLAQAQRFVQSYCQAGKKILLFNPEGSKKTRTLTPARVKEMVELFLKTTPFQVLVLSHKQVYSDLPKAAVLFHSSDLLQTAAIVSRADYVVTVDTGILHIADAFNRPMTVLFAENNIIQTQRPYVEYFWGSKNPRTCHLKAKQSVNEINPINIIQLYQKRGE